MLTFSIAKRRKLRIPLTTHTLGLVQQDGIEVRSFTLTPTSLSISSDVEFDDMTLT